MIAAGVGCTLLPRLASLPGTGSLRDNNTVLMRPFAAPMPTRNIGLAWRRNFPRESTIGTVGAWIDEQLPAEVEKIDASTTDTGSGCAPASSHRAEALSTQIL